MKRATLCFLLARGGPGGGRILLGRKKRGFGRGKLNGFGGKLESGESFAAAAVRELAEEAGVAVAAADLVPAARLAFVFPHRPQDDHEVCAFTAERWSGRPRETDEMAPAWFPLGKIPYGAMWADDAHWLPRVLAGERVRGTFTFAADGETLAAFRLAPWNGALPD